MNDRHPHRALALLAAGLLCLALDIVEIVDPGRLPAPIEYPSA